MRKRYCLGLVLAVLLTAGLIYVTRMELSSVVLYPADSGRAGAAPYVSVRMAQGTNNVYMWQNEESGKSYFFLPSCVTHHKIKLGDFGGGSVRIDGQLFESGDVFAWEEDREYRLQITDDTYEACTYALTFMKSENIPAVFINTESGSMEYLHEDKGNEETGDICVVREDGNTEYQGSLDRISGRGNGTWEYEKKAYSIKMSEKYPLCGLDKGNKWCLLALWREGSKVDNKIAMDIAEEMGLAYSAQGTWVDLYLNGEYAGNYLLTESVSVGEGRVDITDLEQENRQYNVDIDSAAAYEEEDNKGYLIENGDDITGGYLIEKDHPAYYESEKCGFLTSAGDQFTINAPKHASKEQVRYMRDYMENIEQLAQSGQPEVWEYLDVDSFVRRFLLDEISFDIDTGVTSMFFYKERGDDKLYSGPGWDYDHSFGDGAANRLDNAGYDYERSVIEECAERPLRLKWYVYLYDTPQMQQHMIEAYTDLLPFFEELLDHRIDEYMEMIDASVRMDRILWEGRDAKGHSDGKYSDYHANVRYTKFFIAKRLNWLCARWGVDHEEFMTPSSGEMHTVTFENFEGVVGTMEIMDGEELENPLEYDGSVFQGWENQYTGESYRKQIPINEDTVFYNPRW